MGGIIFRRLDGDGERFGRTGPGETFVDGCGRYGGDLILCTGAGDRLLDRESLLQGERDVDSGVRERR